MVDEKLTTKNDCKKAWEHNARKSSFKKNAHSRYMEKIKPVPHANVTKGWSEISYEWFVIKWIKDIHQQIKVNVALARISSEDCLELGVACL